MTFSKSDEFCFSVVFVGGVLRQVGEGVSETKKAKLLNWLFPKNTRNTVKCLLNTCNAWMFA